MAAKKILIAEDSSTIRAIVEHKLSHHGFEVHSAKDGEEAWQKIQELKPDLVLLDVIMPAMDGFQVLSKMKKEASLGKIPIIFLTSKGMEADMVKGFELGAVDYIVKPFSPDVLLARVTRALKLNE
jgi:DNA-binding response OmpR family regulator